MSKDNQNQIDKELGIETELVDTAKAVTGDDEAAAVEAVRTLSIGKLVLAQPVTHAGKEYTELAYDLGSLTGWDYVKAMDSDPNNNNIFRLSATQAMSLLGMAIHKAMPQISALEASDLLGMADSINGVRIATVFFVASTRAANKRISRA